MSCRTLARQRSRPRRNAVERRGRSCQRVSRRRLRTWPQEGGDDLSVIAFRQHAAVNCAPRCTRGLAGQHRLVVHDSWRSPLLPSGAAGRTRWRRSIGRRCLLCAYQGWRLRRRRSHERKCARDARTHEAVYSRSHGGSQGVGEEEQEYDRPPLPQGERRDGYRKNDDAADKREQGDMAQCIVGRVWRPIRFIGRHKNAVRAPA